MPRRKERRSRRAFGWNVWLICCVLVSGGTAFAEDAAPASTREFATEVAKLQQMAQGCAASAGACDSASLATGKQRFAGAAGSFEITWDWLQPVFQKAKTAPAAKRSEAMRGVGDHLAALLAQAGRADSSPSPAQFNRARAAANAALAREEFRTVTEGPGWFERQAARLQDALLQLFSGVGRLGQRAPWLAPTIEWCCFGLAAAGLLWFVRQSLARQALRISLGEGALLAGRGAQDAADWARLSEEHAAAQDWREAVHCLYWASIALLETRRVWKPNVTRTPREYLRLLRPESEARQALRELTKQFERVWYGHATATQETYQAAQESFRALEEARPERTPDPGQAGGDASLATAGGA